MRLTSGIALKLLGDLVARSNNRNSHDHLWIATLVAVGFPLEVSLHITVGLAQHIATILSCGFLAFSTGGAYFYERLTSKSPVIALLVIIAILTAASLLTISLFDWQFDGSSTPPKPLRKEPG